MTKDEADAYEVKLRAVVQVIQPRYMVISNLDAEDIQPDDEDDRPGDE